MRSNEICLNYHDFTEISPWITLIRTSAPVSTPASKLQWLNDVLIDRLHLLITSNLEYIHFDVALQWKCAPFWVWWGEKWATSIDLQDNVSQKQSCLFDYEQCWNKMKESHFEYFFGSSPNGADDLIPRSIDWASIFHTFSVILAALLTRSGIVTCLLSIRLLAMVSFFSAGTTWYEQKKGIGVLKRSTLSCSTSPRLFFLIYSPWYEWFVLDNVNTWFTPINFMVTIVIDDPVQFTLVAKKRSFEHFRSVAMLCFHYALLVIGSISNELKANACHPNATKIASRPYVTASRIFTYIHLCKQRRHFV